MKAWNGSSTTTTLEGRLAARQLQRAGAGSVCDCGSDAAVICCRASETTSAVTTATGASSFERGSASLWVQDLMALSRIEGRGSAGAYPSCKWAGGGVQPEVVASQSLGNQSARRKPTQAQGQHSNSTQAGLGLNSGPQNCEANAFQLIHHAATSTADDLQRLCFTRNLSGKDPHFPGTSVGESEKETERQSVSLSESQKSENSKEWRSSCIDRAG
ncbi:uncharacterized protein LOC133502384 [Syngnathoides biaculeatus]|uniref:uncharacterized protein LOC133502384 n=1 Tax=Syngnathoides biaculeatus TaxID=300417 RepID=UPI002ADD374D|nr:uncharacterized protein LOC133502384 [Syngnathoides biaculeatus]